MCSLSSCSVFRNNAKYDFSSGVYNSRVIGKACKVYVDKGAEDVRVYAVRRQKNASSIDSINFQPLSFEQSRPDGIAKKPVFVKNSLDMDFLTIPFKYRPSVQGFPRQFTTQLNAGLFLGYRTDVYTLGYQKNLLGPANRKIQHYGISAGLFTGLGSTSMNPWATGDRISSEYEGVAWSKGIAVIAGINNFSAGVAVGWDGLLDKNKTVWLYQEKPWIGLVFGLSIN